MLEGGGKTPILSPMELEEIGFKIIAYPLSLVGVSIRAMQVKLWKLIKFSHARLCLWTSYLCLSNDTLFPHSWCLRALSCCLYLRRPCFNEFFWLLLQDALAALKSGRLPTPSALPSFENIKEIVGFPQYYTEEEWYTTTSSTSTSSSYNRPSGCSQISVHWFCFPMVSATKYLYLTHFLETCWSPSGFWYFFFL